MSRSEGGLPNDKSSHLEELIRHTPRIAGPWSSRRCDNMVEGTSVAIIKVPIVLSTQFLETRKRM